MFDIDFIFTCKQQKASIFSFVWIETPIEKTEIDIQTNKKHIHTHIIEKRE